MGLTWEEAEASAQDRQTWRQRVALCIGDAGWIKSSQVNDKTEYQLDNKITTTNSRPITYRTPAGSIS